MRIVGGESRGRRLKSLPGRSVRPTSERAREALFDILGERVVGSRFLDLFAGVGAVGLEALSRGAEQAVLVEASERAARVIRQNMDALGAGARARLVRGDAMTALRGLAAAGAKFDIVFMDPPYRDRRGLERALAAITRANASDAAETAVEAQAQAGILAPDAIVVVEHDAHAPPLAATGTLAVERSRRFGEAVLTFFRPHRRPGS